MVLYHGTTILAFESIISKGILADINENTELDYGKGFYASFPEDISYAKAHAKNVTRDVLGIQNLKRNAVLIKIEIDEKCFCDEFVFEKKNGKWVDFVFDTRYNYLNENIPYKIIIGPMADGAVDSLMQVYKKNENNRSQIMNKLLKHIIKFCYRLPFNMHRQIVIKDQAICNKIEIVRATTLKGDVIYEQKK